MKFQVPIWSAIALVVPVMFAGWLAIGYFMLLADKAEQSHDRQR